MPLFFPIPPLNKTGKASREQKKGAKLMCPAYICTVDNQIRKADHLLKHSFYNTNSIQTSNPLGFGFKIYIRS